MNDEQQQSPLGKIIEGATNDTKPLEQTNSEVKDVVQAEENKQEQPVDPQRMESKETLVTDKPPTTLDQSKSISQDVDIIKNAIGKFDEAKLKGYLISNLNITGAQADEVIDSAKFTTQNEMITHEEAKWELYPDKVIEKAVGAIYEFKVRQMEMVELARKRDVNIGMMARELFGTNMADKMVEEAEENYSAFTHVPKDQIRDFLPLEKYKEMLTQFQMSPKYMDAIQRVHNVGLNESEEAAKKFLKSAGFKVEPKQQKTPSYLDFLKGEVDSAKKNVLGNNKKK